MSQSLLPTLVRLTLLAQRKGADAADALAVRGTAISSAVRNGDVERMERAEGADVGLRVFIGKRQAIVSSSDTGEAALEELVERAVAMARNVPEDEFCGLADTARLAGGRIDVDSFDTVVPTPEDLRDMAMTAERAARHVEGVTNSEGAEASYGRSEVWMAATNGFAKSYVTTGSSLSVSVLAGNGPDGMERDYDFTSAVYLSDLRDPTEVGQVAGMRAVKRLGARKVKTAKVPVVFAPRVARSLVSHLAGAINGAAIARGTSFLKDKMGQKIFAEGITIVDDPLRPRGLRSRPCDAEGLPVNRLEIIDDGVLTSWFLDLRSARKLGLESTGHAARGTSSPPSPSPSNLYLAATATTPGDLIADIKDGFYVTELIGSGVNLITGDYSRGASGFWIENGQPTFAVSEMTVAGNLKDMFLNMACADDLTFRYGIDSPTVRVEGLTVAGE